MTVKLDFQKAAPLQVEVRRQFQKAFDTAMLDLADYLQRESPRGVSEGGDSLAAGWDVVPSKKRRGIIPQSIGSVVNTAKNAEFRIRGRGPGKRPPIDAIEAWATAMGISPFLLAKSIGETGTDRWRRKDNILKQDPITLKFAKDSPLYTIFEKRLAEEFAKISI